MYCPNCQHKNLGKIGMNAYYCWDCFIELTIEKNKLILNQIEVDGSVSPLNDLFTEEETTLD